MNTFGARSSGDQQGLEKLVKGMARGHRTKGEQVGSLNQEVDREKNSNQDFREGYTQPTDSQRHWGRDPGRSWP